MKIIKKSNTSLVLALKEHLASGQPITELESIVMFGVPNVPKQISVLRRQGWVIKSQRISYARALRRLNQHVLVESPVNLPICEIQVIEYWVSR